MKFSYKNRLFLTVIAFALSIFVIIQFLNIQKERSLVQKRIVGDVKNYFQKSKNMLRFYIIDAYAKLDVVKESQLFIRSLDDIENNRERLNEFFLSVAKSADNIMQLCYIDADGKERICVNRDDYAAAPYVVEDSGLQNRAAYDHFQKIAASDKEKFLQFGVDFDTRYGKIENGKKPLLHIGTPALKGGGKSGILVVKIFMSKILEEIASSNIYHIYIVDKNGYLLASSDSRKNQNEREHISKYFQEYKRMLHGDEYVGDTYYAAVLYSNGDSDKIRMIIEPTEAFLNDSFAILFREFMLIFIVLFVIAITLFALFSVAPIRLQNRLDERNKDLERKLEEKVGELEELTASLENRIKERTQEQNVLLSLFDLGDAVLFKWNNDAGWSVAYVSQSVERLMGYSADEFKSGAVIYAECIHKEDIDFVTKEVMDAIDNERYFFKPKPYRIITKKKKIKWIMDSTVIVRNDDGEIINFVGYLTDITDLKESEIKLDRLAKTDQLTKISNRLHIDEILREQYYRYIRNKEECSVVMLDIDHFKRINDTYGHLVGDTVLVEFTKIIAKSIRTSDTIGRWGGEEFMLVLPHTKKEEAIALAEKLRKLIDEYVFPSVRHLTASFGVTSFTQGEMLDTTISKADKALYESKRRGRNCVSVI